MPHTYTSLVDAIPGTAPSPAGPLMALGLLRQGADALLAWWQGERWIRNREQQLLQARLPWPPWQRCCDVWAPLHPHTCASPSSVLLRRLALRAVVLLVLLPSLVVSPGPWSSGVPPCVLRRVRKVQAARS